MLRLAIEGEESEESEHGEEQQGYGVAPSTPVPSNAAI